MVLLFDAAISFGKESEDKSYFHNRYDIKKKNRSGFHSFVTENFGNCLYEKKVRIRMLIK